nr:hypothetical protein [Acidimicrobiia bacterium]
MSRRAAVTAVVVLLVVVAGVVLWTALAGDDDEAVGPTTTGSDLSVPDAVEPDLRGDGRALLDLLALRETATYHAVYSGTGPEDAAAGDLVLEVWRSGEQV